MNDFTKEELNILRAAMGEILFFPETKRVINKIQSLIDNYCEHECNGEVETFIDTCRKCNAYLLRESHHDN